VNSYFILDYIHQKLSKIIFFKLIINNLQFFSGCDDVQQKHICISTVTVSATEAFDCQHILPCRITEKL